MTTPESTLRQVAERLYAVEPSRFVAARKAAAANASSDRSLSAQIGKLPKPAAAAAIINAFVRSTRAGIDDLTDIGKRLREAEENGDSASLRALGQERRTAVSSVTRAVVELARSSGASVSSSTSDSIEATLQAVVLDPAAASAIRSGLLIKPLVPGADVEPATALLLGDHAPAPLRSKTRRKIRREGEAEAREARSAADKAQRAADEARRALMDAEERAASLQAARDANAARMDGVRNELDRLRRNANQLEGDLDAAKEAERRAKAIHRAATSTAKSLQHALR